MTVHNEKCDGASCIKAVGEVRLLPQPAGGNAILCQACYRHEMAFRRDMNRDRPALYKYDIPPWKSLKVYEGGEPCI